MSPSHVRSSLYLIDPVAARLGGAGSVRGLPSCLGLMLRLAVSCGILRVVSGLEVGPGSSFLASTGWDGVHGG